MKADDRIKITNVEDKYTLENTNVLKSDAGEWTAVVKNRLAEKSVAALLDVIPCDEFRRPKMTKGLDNRKIQKGTSTTFEIEFTADPLPDIEWLKNGKKIEDKRMKYDIKEEVLEHNLKKLVYTMTLPEGAHEDSGDYTFKAKNKYGAIETSCRLEVLQKPEIVGLKDQSSLPYKQIVFQANIYSNPKPKVTWTRNGENLCNVDHCDVLSDFEKEVFTLIVENVTVNDDATYVLTASNEHGETVAEARLKVEVEKPKFTKVPRLQNIHDHANVEMIVAATGVPHPTLKWYTGDVEIDSKFLAKENRFKLVPVSSSEVEEKLTIADFSIHDPTSFRVVATNMAGSTDVNFGINIEEQKPQFNKVFDKFAEVPEGQKLLLETVIDGSPFPQVEWYKDSIPLKPDDHVKLEANPDGRVKLLIEHVNPDDGGAYKLAIKNPSGDDSVLCAVAIIPEAKAPKFTKTIEDGVVKEGEPLVLETVISAFPTPAIKWFKDGLPLYDSPNLDIYTEPGGKIGLRIKEAQLEDAGIYSIVATNDLGEAKTAVPVTVVKKEEKPLVIKELQNAQAVEGLGAKFDVKVLGFPKPTLKWLKDDKEVDVKQTPFVYTENPDGSASLIITEVKPGDSGKYQVVATNPLGTTASVAALDVVPPVNDKSDEEAPTWVTPLQDAVAEEGGQLAITGKFRANPIPEIYWKKDGEPIKPDGKKISILCDNSNVQLVINPTDMNDGGEYSCFLANPLGETESKCIADVRKSTQGPSFGQRFNEVQVAPGEDAKLLAKVTGTPTPDVTWFKDDQPISDNSKFEVKRLGDNCKLTIKDAQPSDAGIYSCIAENPDGKANSDFKVQVVDKDKP